MNMSVKDVRERRGYSGQKAFLGMAMAASISCLPALLLDYFISTYCTGELSSLSYLQQAYNKAFGQEIESGERDFWPFQMLVIAAVAYHIEYLLNFIFVGFVNPVAFSVSDIARRLAIILVGAKLFGKVLRYLSLLFLFITTILK